MQGFTSPPSFSKNLRWPTKMATNEYFRSGFRNGNNQNFFLDTFRIPNMYVKKMCSSGVGEVTSLLYYFLRCRNEFLQRVPKAIVHEVLFHLRAKRHLRQLDFFSPHSISVYSVALVSTQKAIDARTHSPDIVLGNTIAKRSLHPSEIRQVADLNLVAKEAVYLESRDLGLGYRCYLL